MRMRLGEILLEESLLAPDRLRQLLRYQRQNGGFLGSLLLELGLLPEVTVVRLLARQLGTCGVCLSGHVVPEDVAGLLPEDQARALGALPLELEQDALRVAFAAPDDEAAVRAVSRRTGRRILAAVALRSTLDAAMRSSYGRPRSACSPPPRYVYVSRADVGTKAGAATPLIPRALLFGNAPVYQAGLSPDGRRVSFLGAGRRGRALFVRNVSDGSSATELADDSEVRLLWHRWTSDGNHILYGGDVNGNEKVQVFSVDVRTGVRRALPVSWHGAGRRKRSNARVLHVSPAGEAVIELYDSTHHRCEVYRVDLASGRNASHHGVSDGSVSQYWADGSGELRVCLQHEEGSSVLCARSESEWKPFFEMPREDWHAVEVVGVDDSGRYCFLLDGNNHALAHVVRVDLRSGGRAVVAEPRNADIEDVIVRGEDVVGVVEHHPRTGLRIFCPELARDHALLQRQIGGVPRATDCSDDDSVWLVRSSRDDHPLRYFLYERTTGRVRPLLDSRPGLARYRLETMQPVTVPARDGLKLPCYLTLPSWAPRDRPLPTVILLHGGPTARDYWGFDPEHQWLANRGYAVLSVNYRGSTGFGKRLRCATPYWIAPEMVEDVLDAASWAIENGIADAERIGIMGASYGGYLVLEGLVRAPELFQCGVDLFGVSDWKSCGAFDAVRTKLGLDSDGMKALLEARSPLYHADRIEKPLLVAQGTSDVRVEPDQSSSMVRALSVRNKPVTYLVYDEEGHGFYREESRLSYYAVVEAFLATHLGGRRESFGSDLEDGGLSILTGASRIPGLEAYRRASSMIESAVNAPVSRLDLSGLGLRELPPAVRKLERLEHLDLSDNRLTHLPVEIGLLSRLETLDLSNNQLLKLPEELGSIWNLRELDLSGNQLSALPRSLRSVETLRRVRLRGNPLPESALWGFRRTLLR